MKNPIEKYLASINNPLKFNAFLFLKLPAAWFMGIRVLKISAEKCEVKLPFGWRSQNPFHSIYFAAQTAAGELSTGLLAQAHLQGQPPVSMLVVRAEAEFFKKASATVIFTCEEGEAVRAVIQKTLADGQGYEIKMTSVGRLPDGEIASKIYLTWSFRRKKIT